MDGSEILAYLGALVVGLVLGLIGGGGSILTVPILVYLLGLNPVIATAYSLFVVGVTSAIGAFQNLRKKLVDIKTAIIFSIPAFMAVYVTRRWLVPAIPDELFSINSFLVSKDIFIMIFFAIIMLLASISMIFSRHKAENELPKIITYNYPMIAIEGFGVGILTGIVGAGGGFLIIPALVLLAKLPMKKAVGTSLLIIAVKSLIGFLGDVQTLTIDWKFLLTFTSISILGILFGIYLSKLISGKKLKKGFGWFTLIMAIYIIFKELL
ncbi:sulfite exporter TauE/SafE family protein [Ichthyenterobacterium sp. W332]|uniref:Probable membrane transporter protein n=1 Tax=Microcosmobacter mediterraneus TaxID=3075607 RepID=A0ABU2YFS5_9FLAO|nr:sulfite exporter TauE/SafE family protein [Ichthyenterobacterium sp. W332]MDT0557029.1 sulfite exporter TauE/SafE family protein [Ichthyenterobacterium sp. W332]